MAYDPSNIPSSQMIENQKKNHLCFSCVHTGICRMDQAIRRNDEALYDQGVTFPPRYYLAVSQCGQYLHDGPAEESEISFK